MKAKKMLLMMMTMLLGLVIPAIAEFSDMPEYPVDNIMILPVDYDFVSGIPSDWDAAGNPTEDRDYPIVIDDGYWDHPTIPVDYDFVSGVPSDWDAAGNPTDVTWDTIVIDDGYWDHPTIDDITVIDWKPEDAIDQPSDFNWEDGQFYDILPVDPKDYPADYINIDGMDRPVDFCWEFPIDDSAFNWDSTGEPLPKSDYRMLSGLPSDGDLLMRTMNFTEGTPTPEPATMSLLLLGAGWLIRRKA